MGRKTFRIVAGLSAVLALTLASCGSSVTDAEPTTDQSSTQTEESSVASTEEAPAETQSSEETTEDAQSSEETTEAADELSGTLTVFAAASLKKTFDQIRTEFMAAHPAVDFPEITYDGSSTLVTQIQEGAPADVFASADEANMDKIADAVTDRVDFATNTLQIAVAPGNPKGITSLADLAKDGIVTVICAAEVPCGAASHRALDAAGVTLTPASEEQNVTAVLTKVSAGEADAGLVYATDVQGAAGAVDGVDFPEAAEAVNTYPIAVLKDSANVAAAQAFLQAVTSGSGPDILAAAGFGKP